MNRNESEILIRKSRIEWIDESKGIAILFLCIYHVIQYFSDLYPDFLFLLSALFPIFMFCSGILELQKDLVPFREWLKKKSKSLLIPWCVFSIINSLLKIGVLLVLNRLTSEIIRDEMFDLFLRGNGPNYYLIMLFFAELLLYGVRKIFADKQLFLYFTALIAVIPFIFPIAQVEKEWIWLVLLRRTIVTYGFLIIGFFLYNTVFKYLNKSKFLIILFSIACIITGTVILYKLNVVFDLWNAIFTGKIWCLLSAILLGIGWIGIFIGFNKCDIRLKKLTYLGEKSLPIMLIHTLLLSVYTYPFASRISSQSNVLNAILSILLVVYIVVGSLIIYNIYRKVVKKPII